MQNEPLEGNYFVKSYKIRTTGQQQRSVITTIPREIIEREARRFEISIEEAIRRLRAIWRYNDSELSLRFQQEKDT